MVAHIFGNRLARVGRKSAEQTEKVAPSPYPPGILAGNVLQRSPGEPPSIPEGPAPPDGRVPPGCICP